MAKNKIEIPKLILDHLLQYGNVSILGLGTLYFDYKSAYLSDDKSQIFPPSNSVQFNDSTNHTDQLIAYVANRLGVNTKKALNKIDKYAQHITNDLLNYGKAEIPSIGQFVKGDDENIVFSQNYGEVNSEFFGLMPVKLKPIQFFKEGEMNDAPMAVSTESVPNRKASVANTVTAVTTNIPPSYNYNDEDESSWLKPLLWIFGLVLLSALLYKGCEAYKNKQTSVSTVDQVDNTDGIKNGNGSDAVNVDDANVDSANGSSDGNTGVVADTTNKSKRPTECVIIIGAYESARNAMKMSTRISQLGYIPYEEYFDTMDVTRVGFKFDCGEKDLRDFMHEVRKEIAKDAWYLVPRITVE